MRFARFTWTLVVFLAAPCWSQTTPPAHVPLVNQNPDPLWIPHPARDTNGVNEIQASINALGGSAAIGQLLNYVVHVQVLPSSGSGAGNGQAVWTVAGAEYLEEYPSAQGEKTLGSGHGKGWTNLNGGQATPISPHVLRATFVPELVGLLLLNELQDKNSSIRYIGPSKLGDSSVIVLEIVSLASRVDATVTWQRWYFDASSKLAVRIEHRLPDLKFPTRFVTVSVDLSDYQAISGVFYPTRVVRTINGSRFDTLLLGSVQTNTSIATSLFDPPGGVQ